MANRPTIRKAEPPDAAGIKECVEAAYRRYIPRMGQKPGPMLDEYSQVVSRHQAFVLEESGHVIGVAVLVSSDEGILLDNVAVHPDHQGEGLGRQLMEFAESEAVKQGYSSLELYTHESMTENISLYKYLGYVETDRRTESGFGRVYMRKNLA
jgi:ribosomal protein S18 acetylase RimI-like enzyme